MTKYYHRLHIYAIHEQQMSNLQYVTCINIMDERASVSAPEAFVCVSPK